MSEKYNGQACYRHGVFIVVPESRLLIGDRVARCSGATPVLKRHTLLGRRLILHFFPMMLDDASCGRSHDGMMAGHVSNNAANGRTLQAAFGASDPCE
jgi:hypothetical protein